MTLKECYHAMGGNYDEVMARLRTEERVTKFLLRVPGDTAYPELCAALESGDAQTAFRAAHTIKGVCLNLSLTALYESANELTEALRGQSEITPSALQLFERLRQDYDNTINAINGL